MQGGAIRVAIDNYGPHAKLTARAQKAHGNLASVCNQDFTKHRLSQVNARF